MAKRKGKEGWIVPGKEKLALVLGRGADAAMNTFVSTFLAIYLLMVGIDASIAALVLLFIKVWDAVNDMLFGFIVDKIRFKPGKSKLTRWLFGGRYMPWFRIFFLVIPIGTMIIFTINTSWPIWARVVQYVLGYVLFDLGLTITSVTTLAPISMTNNYDERTSIIAWSGLGQGFGALPVVFLGTVFIAGSLGYTGAAVVFCVLGILLAIPPALFVKERNTTAYDAENMESYTIKDMLRALKTVPELLILEIGVLLWGLFYTTGYGLFVSYYVFHDANISVITSLLGIIPSILLIPFLPAIFRRMDKIVVARIACILFAVCGVAMNLLGPNFFLANLPVFYVLTLLQTTAYVMTMFSGSMLIPDIAEMVKYRTGKDVAGCVTATYSFVTKLVSSLVTSVSLLILGAYGWISVEANSFEELATLNTQGIGLQTDAALQGLWNVSYLFPVVGFALAAVAFFFVKIKRDKVTIYMKANSGEITREEAEKLL